jgi:extracellular elastinolytic metalloproteinase
MNCSPIRLTSVCAVALSVLATTSGAQEYGPHFDRRLSMAMTMAGPPPSQLAAVAKLRADLGGSLLHTLDERSGVTRTLSNPVGHLTGPSGGDPVGIALDFVRANLELLGLFPGDLDEMAMCDVVFSQVSGSTHVYFCQSHRGVPVFNGLLQVNVNRDGAIVSVANSFVPNLQGQAQANVLGTEIEAVDARFAAASHLGVRIQGAFDAEEISTEPIVEELTWLPVGSGMKLVWRFRVHTLDGAHAYDFTVDAEPGDDPRAASRVMTRFDWMSPGIYQVYALPTESPNHASPAPPADGRSIVSFPAEPTASPLGWHDDGSTLYTIMRGNNVHAYDDLDNNNQPPPVQPDCGAGLDCSFPIDLNADPTSYTSAAVANLFYWNNVIHDVQYQYGFDEAGGNFQKNNFGLGGLGGDDVRAEAQDGAGVNNANFLPAVDGQRPRIQMYLWDFTFPRRDGDFDNGVIVHEYGHGISTRLVGGPSNVSCLSNFQQPGEGLSDWWALVYTARASDVGADPRGLGTYVVGDAANGSGIRTQPYSTDPNLNDHTYESIAGMAIPHGVGEVWGQAAWEVYWALVNQYGFDPDLYNAMGGAGNQRAMLYVNEGLKNTICSPTFTDVRDGIIQAAVDNYGGEDVCLLWEAFAEFGLGIDAISGGPWSVNPTNGFDIPAACVGPSITDPVPGSVLPGADVTFQWEPASANVTEWWLYLGNNPGDNDLHDSGSLGTSTSTNVTGLPVDGRAIHVRLRFRVDGGAWEHEDFTYTAADFIPKILSPPPGSVLPSQATFEWSANGSSVDDWQLQLGSALGDTDIYDSGMLGAVTTVTVSGLPTDGRTVHARLSFLIAGEWDARDYVYSADFGSPEITDPVPGTVLPGASATFEWVSNGAPVSDYRLFLGSVVGEDDIYNSGSLGSASSVNVASLPINGSAIHARLWSFYAGVWHTSDFHYTAADLAAAIVSPTPGSTLAGAAVTFTWTDNGAPVTDYKLYVGSGVGSYDIFNSGSLGTTTSVLASGLPTDSRTLYVRLWSYVFGRWSVEDYVYTAANLTPSLSSPPPGSTLPGADVTFTWDGNGVPVTDYKLYVGSSFGGYDLFNSGSIGTITSVALTALPTDARTLYVRLWYRVSGTWKVIDTTYTAADLSPTMASPPPGAVLSGANVTFSWTSNGAPVTQWRLYLGTTLGGYNLFSSGIVTTTSALATNLPTNGATIHARLWSKIGNTWSFEDFLYTASTSIAVSMDSPAPGSVLAGADVTFQWSASGSVSEWTLQIGSALGGNELYDSGSLGASTSVSVAGLPADGRDIWVRLASRVGTIWQTDDFLYTAADFSPSMFSPIPGSTLSGAEVTFQWSDNGAPVDDWQLQLGSTLGDADIYDSGPLGASTTVTVSGIPTDGSAVWARLGFLVAGTWDFLDAAYSTAPGSPKITAPVPGSVLTGSTATFQWTPNGALVTDYKLYVGSGFGAYDLFNSASLGTATSVVANGLPTDARTLYVRLWYRVAGTWKPHDVAYTAADLSPAITSPTPGSTLSGADVTFTWSDNGVPVTDYKLYVGTGLGAYNLFNSGSLGTLTSVLVSALPTDSRTLYVRLWYRVAGRWKIRDTTYTAADLSPTIVSPPPGADLTSANVTFTWTSNGAAVSQWKLYLGTYLGGSNLLYTGIVTSTSALATNLPTNGSTIHARLWSKNGSVWSYRDFVYTSAKLVN